MTSIHLGYIVSCLAENRGKGVVSHVPMLVSGRTQDEATGCAYRMASEIFPADDGYLNPHVVARSMSMDDWLIRELYAQLDAAA